MTKPPSGRYVWSHPQTFVEHCRCGHKLTWRSGEWEKRCPCGLMHIKAWSRAQLACRIAR